MPMEYVALKYAPVPLDRCPSCFVSPFVPMARGCVQRSKRKYLIGPKQPYCALICERCKQIVGWEQP